MKNALKLSLGQWAENQAVILLQHHDYMIQARNYFSRYGEIDIIAQKDQVLIFVEVKARGQTTYGEAHEVISRSKQIKMMKTVLDYLAKDESEHDLFYRFDVICFDFHQKISKKQQSDFSSFSYDLSWIENAFTFDSDLINL